MISDGLFRWWSREFESLGIPGVSLKLAVYHQGRGLGAWQPLEDLGLGCSFIMSLAVVPVVTVLVLPLGTWVYGRSKGQQRRFICAWFLNIQEAFAKNWMWPTSLLFPFWVSLSGVSRSAPLTSENVTSCWDSLHCRKRQKGYLKRVSFSYLFWTPVKRLQWFSPWRLI